MRRVSARSKAGLPTGPWQGGLVLSFSRSAWFSDGTDSLVAVVGEGLSASPRGIELAGALPSLLPDTALETDGNLWFLNGIGEVLNVKAAPDRTAVLSLGSDDLRPTASWFQEWKRWFDTSLPDTPEGRWLATLAAGPGGDWESLVGRGSGSTPLGDDYLAGWFAARRRRGLWSAQEGSRLRRALPRTSRLSRHYLFQLTEGRVDTALGDFLAGPMPPRADSALGRKLAEHGDLSGRATLVGLYAGLSGAPQCP